MERVLQMELNKENLKKIRGLILFTAFVVVALVNYKVLISVAKFLFNIIFPFVLGICIAFVLNAPSNFYERHLFRNNVMKDKKITKKLARPCSLVLSILSIIGVVFLVIFVVVPELGNTVVELSRSVTVFVPQAASWLNDHFQENSVIAETMKGLDLEFDWSGIMNSVVDFVKNGATEIVGSTYSVLKSVVGIVSDFVIGFVFACYIVLQKEKLRRQVRKVMDALLPELVVDRIEKICSLTYWTFLNFLTGQCVEAVLLGLMFVVIMTIFGFPYAILVGILIAFTALIPIFGAFIGCAVGTFLILVENPMQALLFVVMFLILQQIEGNFIYPHVVGNSVGLPSIWVLMAVSVGGSLMGIAGMLIFIPLVSVIYTLFREYVYSRLRKKNKQ